VKKKHAKSRARAKLTTKRKGGRSARAIASSSEEVARRRIVAELQRLERHRHTEMERRERELATVEARGEAVPPKRILKARIRLHEAALELGEVLALRREIEDILRDTEQRLAVLEVEARCATTDAIARYHTARAMRRAGPSPGLSQQDLATELVKVKQATAVVIADRNRMRDELAALAATPERAGEAEELRRELALQEASVAKLKHGLRVLLASVALIRDSSRPELRRN